MYEVVKYMGSFFEPLKNAPKFLDRDEAESWASIFLFENPELFKRGLESVGVRKVRLSFFAREESLS